MDKAKYIIVESEDLGLESPILFPIWLNHANVARSLLGTCLRDTDKILSAGFVTVIPKRDYGIEVSCFGRSESLDLESRESDGKLVARALGIE